MIHYDWCRMENILTMKWSNDIIWKIFWPWDGRMISYDICLTMRLGWLALRRYPILYLFPSLTGWTRVWLHYSEHMATLTCSNGLNLEWYTLCYYFIYFICYFIYLFYLLFYLFILFIYYLFQSTMVSKANVCKCYRLYFDYR